MKEARNTPKPRALLRDQASIFDNIPQLLAESWSYFDTPKAGTISLHLPDQQVRWGDPSSKAAPSPAAAPPGWVPGSPCQATSPLRSAAGSLSLSGPPGSQAKARGREAVEIQLPLRALLPQSQSRGRPPSEPRPALCGVASSQPSDKLCLVLAAIVSPPNFPTSEALDAKEQQGGH